LVVKKTKKPYSKSIEVKEKQLKKKEKETEKHLLRFTQKILEANPYLMDDDI